MFGWVVVVLPKPLSVFPKQTHPPLRLWEGRFIHTYQENAEPLPSFEGEPRRVSVSAPDAETLASQVWASLNEDNKVSLFVRFIDIETGKYETRIVNKNH